MVLLGGVVRGTAQISALSLKRAHFIRIGIYICLLPLGQDNEELLDTKHQIYTRYSAIRDINVIPNPQLAVGVGSENICCCLDRPNAIMSCMLLPSAGFCRTQMREEYTSGSTGSDCYCWNPIPENKATFCAARGRILDKKVHKAKKEIGAAKSSQGRRGKPFLGKEGEALVTGAQNTSY